MVPKNFYFLIRYLAVTRKFNIVLFSATLTGLGLSVQQLAELEKLEKDNRDKNRKLERKNADLTQTNKRLESRNKMLLDEINTLVRCFPL